MLSFLPDRVELKGAFAKIVCEPGWKWAKRDKPLATYDLFYVWSGEGEVVLNGRAYPVGTGSCFLFRPGDETSATHSPQHPLTLTYIHFDVTGREDADRSTMPGAYRIVAGERDWFEKLLARYVRVRLDGGFAADEEAKLTLLQLLVLLLREEQGGHPPTAEAGSAKLAEAIRETANYIRQHPGRSHRLDELAGRAGLSAKYFSARFKELVGESVQAYLIRVRMERAEHLLRYGGMTVTEVADALGYRDVFFFSRQFKRHTGVSPSKLR